MKIPVKCWCWYCC